MIVRLPVPPATNNLFVNKKVGGRFISPAYKAWRTEAGWALKLRKPALQVFGPIPVEIWLMVPRKPVNRDIDNFAKGPLDLLVAHGIISDDKQVARLTIERHDDDDLILNVEQFSRPSAFMWPT